MLGIQIGDEPLLLASPLYSHFQRLRYTGNLVNLGHAARDRRSSYRGLGHNNSVGHGRRMLGGEMSARGVVTGDDCIKYGIGHIRNPYLRTGISQVVRLVGLPCADTDERTGCS